MFGVIMDKEGQFSGIGYVVPIMLMIAHGCRCFDISGGE